MIKTLRIISVVVAVFAVVLFGFLAVKSFWGGKEASKAGESAGVVDKFRKNRSAGTNTENGQSSPLVSEAQKFSLYLNPPIAPKPVEIPSDPNAPVAVMPVAEPKPEKVMTRFNLIGTCYLPTEPNSSLALIDEVGKGMRWVRQSSMVGHLLIQEVKDGSITVKDGATVTEMEVPKEQKTSLLKCEGGSKGVNVSPAGLPAQTQQANPQESIAAIETAMKQVQTLEGQSPDSQRITSPVSPRDSRNVRRSPAMNQGVAVNERELQRISNPSGDSNSTQTDPNKGSKVSRYSANRRAARSSRPVPPKRVVDKDANSGSK